jgi:hypothetical protein
VTDLEPPDAGFPIMPSDHDEVSGLIAIPHDRKPGWWSQRGAAAAGWIHDVPAIATAVNSGRAVRIVGPDRLLQGLNSGAFTLPHDGTGFLGIVRDRGSGQVVGHLRFEPVGWGNALAAAGFQAGSAITLQYYLYEINARLDRILHDVERLREFLEARADAELDTAEHLIDRIVERIAVVGGFDDLAIAHLAEARSLATTAHAHAQRLLAASAERVDAATRAYQESLGITGRTAPLKAVGLRGNLLDAFGEARAVAPTYVRLCRSVDVLARLDVLEEFTFEEWAVSHVRARWRDRAAAVDVLVGSLAALDDADKVELRRLLAPERKVLRELDAYRETVAGYRRVAGVLKRVSEVAQPLGAYDIVGTKKGVVAVELDVAS